MKSYLKEKLLYFSVSFLTSFTLFFSVIAVLLLPKTENVFVADQSIKENYYTAPLPDLSRQYLVDITDLPLYFYISLSSSVSRCEVLTFPKFSVKNSTIFFNTESPLDSYRKFFSVSPDTLISIDSSSLEQLVNLSGGIVMPTPYGITSPAMPEKYIATDHEARLFGFGFLSIINDEIMPEQKRMAYYSQVICHSLKSVLSDFSQKDLDFLNNKLKLNISYVDYYNNRKTVESCFKKISYRAPEGVWINGKYFLK